MALKPLRISIFAFAVAGLFAGMAMGEAQLRIPIPKRDKATPVQKLNRDGVKYIQKHNYNKAKEAFYHAYLLDPEDPFTLNNLGYVSELQGDVDRAERYYELARRNASEAVVDKSNEKQARGKSFAEVVRGVQSNELAVNRYNVEAIRLLSHSRPIEAENVLQKALALAPNNAYTLNNLGYAKESEGEWKDALRYYQQAASLNSEEPVIVAINQRWRGRPISKVAGENARAMQNRLNRRESDEEQVARLNLRGVTAINRNDVQTARSFFEQAYKVDPEDAFTLNNMGYVSELNGDRETADQFYAKARTARDAESRVTLSTHRNMQGMKLGVVADVNDQKVQNRIETAAEARRREGGPIQLKLRNGGVVNEPETPPAPPGSELPALPAQPAPQSSEPALQENNAPSQFEPAPPQLPAPDLPGTETNPARPQQQPAAQPPLIQPQVQPPQTGPDTLSPQAMPQVQPPR